MKHCEKCIHYEKCKADMEVAPDDTFSFFPYNEDCPHFKNNKLEELKNTRNVEEGMLVLTSSESLIPREKVLEDMALGDGIVSSGAKSYYKRYYATEKEKRAIDRKDKLASIGAALIYCSLIALLVFCIFGGCE